jgi:glycine/D-amino acid oxidase-like deaminating enzyme
MKNNSPWIHQLNKDREVHKLVSDIETDVTIVGGGIAGVSTAFFILRNTDKRVALLEGGRLGHGATGHNAGQLTSYFARSLSSLVKDFGVEKTMEAQKNIEEDAWTLLDIMYTEGRLGIPFSRFVGHLGLSSKEHLLSLLEDNKIRQSAGLEPKEILIADHADFIKEIEEKYQGLYTLVPHVEVLERLETKRSEFIACLSEQKGCLNSALFTEKIAEYLAKTYPERFSMFEHAHVKKVVLHEGFSLLDVDTHTVKAERVVLATNGFDTLTIFNKSGLDIDTRFHHSISGKVGYMSGYLEDLNKPPMAISYFTDPDASSDDPYFYLTRRMFEHEKNNHNLISVGGLEIDLENKKEYEKNHEYPERARDEIDTFVRSVYETDKKEIDYIFTWHGLMGYTNNLLRLVGVEPKNPVLLYNLGCNGVGILPSIFGAERISHLLLGEEVRPSIFDPQDSS